MKTLMVMLVFAGLGGPAFAGEWAGFELRAFPLLNGEAQAGYISALRAGLELGCAVGAGEARPGRCAKIMESGKCDLIKIRDLMIEIAKIEKYQKKIVERKSRISELEKDIANLEQNVSEAEAAIQELQKLL